MPALFRQLLISPAVDMCATFTAQANPVYVPGRLFMGGTTEMDTANASGWLTAVDVNTGTIRWQYLAAGSGNPSALWTRGNVGSATVVVFSLP